MCLLFMGPAKVPPSSSLASHPCAAGKEATRQGGKEVLLAEYSSEP